MRNSKDFSYTGVIMRAGMVSLTANNYIVLQPRCLIKENRALIQFGFLPRL